MFSKIIFISIISGLWGPLLRAISNKRKGIDKVLILMAIARNRLGSSIPYYQAPQQNFCAAQKA